MNILLVEDESDGVVMEDREGGGMLVLKVALAMAPLLVLLLFVFPIMAFPKERLRLRAELLIFGMEVFMALLMELFMKFCCENELDGCPWDCKKEFGCCCCCPKANCVVP